MTENQATHSSSVTAASRGGNPLGFVLLIPALAACLVSQAIPVIRTFFSSFFDSSSLGSSSRFIGIGNYARLAQAGLLLSPFGFSNMMALTRIIACILPPLFLGWAASGLRPGMRKFLRSASTLPLALYSPVILGISWTLIMKPLWLNLGDPHFIGVQAQVILIDALSWLGLSLGFGLSLAMSAVSGSLNEGETKRPWTAFVALSLIMALAATALSPQNINLPLSMSLPGLRNLTPAMAMYSVSFMQMRLGEGSAFASLIILIAACYGMIACAVVLLSRIKLSLRAHSFEPVMAKAKIKVLPIVALIFSIFAILFSVLPFFLMGIPNKTGISGIELGRFFTNLDLFRSSLITWLPAFFVVFFIQLPVSYLAGLGIGALRPLGRASPALLFLFSPFLFLGTSALSLDFYKASIRAPEFIAAAYRILPYLLNVPMVFIFSLFFSGQAQAREACPPASDPSFFKTFIKPSLPLAGILAMLSFAAVGQDYILPWVMAVSQKNAGLFIQLSRIFRIYSREASLQVGTWLLWLSGALIAMAALVPFQCLYLDRLEIKAGKKNM